MPSDIVFMLLWLMEFKVKCGVSRPSTAIVITPQYPIN